MPFIDVQAHMNNAIQLIERHLPLDKWSFKESIRFVRDSIDPVVIYDSEICRVRFVYDVQSSRLSTHHLIIHYGSLKAPDNGNILLSQAQEKEYHLLWHSVRLLLYFLDGLSPQEAKNAKQPQLVREFDQSEVIKDIKYEPEKTLVMHAQIWETYRQRLFDIFDARNKELWERYSAFVSEYWRTLPQV